MTCYPFLSEKTHCENYLVFILSVFSVTEPDLFSIELCTHTIRVKKLNKKKQKYNVFRINAAQTFL